MVKTLIHVVVPGSRRLADEFTLPLLLMAAISLLVGVVGTLDMGSPAPAGMIAPVATMNGAACPIASWSETQARFILVSTHGKQAGGRCRL